MNVMKKGFSAIAIIFLLAIIFSVSPARADGLHGVTETAKEILVEVPRFCRPLKVKWEVRWEENATNADAVLSLMKVDDKKTIRFLSDKPGALRVQTVWRGGATVHIPKFDSKGKPIKIEQLSILALGGGDKLMNERNWALVAVDGKVMVTSPPVNVGTWGKCT